MPVWNAVRDRRTGACRAAWMTGFTATSSRLRDHDGIGTLN